MKNMNLHPPIDAILKSRYHGAANIRGIRFQVLYSVLRAFDLYEEADPDSSVMPEGLEDFDISSIETETVYVQVKTSTKSWNWAKLKDVLKSFIEIHRANPKSQYNLVVDFELKTDLARLASRVRLSSADRDRIDKKFLKLCKSSGASDAEALEILNRLTLVSIPEQELQIRLQEQVITRFELSSEAYVTYLDVLVARFLEWSKERRKVSRADLETVRVRVGEALASEGTFQAYGSGLIQQISWSPDNSTNDFLDGKNTRPGHIANDLDVHRSKWIDKIDEAVNISKICILRASSGQGKSTLLFRYACDFWPADHTYIIRAVGKPEELEALRAFIQFRSETGLPMYLLIDNVDMRTQLWPLIAQQAKAFGIPILVSCRHEDWFRFAIDSLTGYEIVEPVLTPIEAGEIFERLASGDRIHESVVSAGWAFEKLGEPQLLMEFVYLVTHGQLLEDRLRDQLNVINRSGEDAAKIEILRRVSLAHTLGSRMETSALLSEIEFRDDPQFTLKSLIDEYISEDGNWVSGLHWVRSRHLTDILHESYPNPVTTIMSIIGSVPSESLSQFVTNALNWQKVNSDELLEQLVNFSIESNTEIVALVVEGVFRAGEHNFFQANKELFDQAFELVGPTGVSLLASTHMPVVKTDALSSLAKIEGFQFDNFRKLRDISLEFTNAPRGLDVCKRFLEEVISKVGIEFLMTPTSSTCDIIDWISLCNIDVPDWKKLRDNSLECAISDELELSSFKLLCQAVHRLDPEYFQKWFSSHQYDILGYLMLKTRSTEIEISGDVLKVEFIVDDSTTDTHNEQAVSRLKSLRMTIPFLQRYESQGIWLLPSILAPTDDETTKSIPIEHLPSESDVNKNVSMLRQIETSFGLNSSYEFQSHWMELRQASLTFVQQCRQNLGRIIEGRNLKSSEDWVESMNLVTRLIQTVPDLLPQTGVDLKSSFDAKVKDWRAGIQNFASQILQWLLNQESESAGGLAVFNIRSTNKALSGLHEAWDELLQVAPDHFQITGLNERESRSYKDLADMVEACIKYPPQVKQRRAGRYVKQLHDKKTREDVLRLNRLKVTLTEKGIDTEMSAETHDDYPLKYLAIAFSVSNPLSLEDELSSVLTVLSEADEVADIFWLIPLHEGNRFVEGGFQISASQASAVTSGTSEVWECLIPQELPDAAYVSLPHFTYLEIPELRFRSSALILFEFVSVHDELQTIVNELKKSGNGFKVRLGEIEYDQLHQMRISLHDMAVRSKKELETHYNSHANNSSYDLLLQFFDQVSYALSEDSRDELVEINRPDSDELDSAIQDLLELNS